MSQLLWYWCFQSRCEMVHTLLHRKDKVSSVHSKTVWMGEFIVKQFWASFRWSSFLSQQDLYLDFLLFRRGQSFRAWCWRLGQCWMHQSFWENIVSTIPWCVLASQLAEEICNLIFHDQKLTHRMSILPLQLLLRWVFNSSMMFLYF